MANHRLRPARFETCPCRRWTLFLVLGFFVWAESLVAREDEKTEPQSEASKKSPAIDSGSASSTSDRLVLLNGQTYDGYVVDSGDNSVRVEIGGSARRVLKRDIKSVTFNSLRRSDAMLEHDRIEFKDGHTIDGEVKVVEGGTRVVVKVARKNAGGAKSAVVSYPMASVRRIRWKDDKQFGSVGKYYTIELQKTVDQAFKDLSSKDAKVAIEAENRLQVAGIFVIERARKEYEKRFAELAGESHPARVKDPRLFALRNLIHSYELKMLMPTTIQDITPDVYDTLSYRTTVHERSEFLKAILPNFPEESVELILFLIKDPWEDQSIRAISVDFLRRLQLNQALLNLYNESEGQLQFIAATALARNRILLGVPTLIDALALDREKVRELASNTLLSSTGQDFRFRSDGALPAREAAIKRWDAWWIENQNEIEKNAVLILRGGQGKSPEWKTATEYWKKAHAAWQGKKLKAAVDNLKLAIDADPSFLKAPISLAALYYQELDQREQAKKLLLDLADRPLPTTTSRDLYWIHFELGNVYLLEKSYLEALTHYVECISIDPDNITSKMAKADCHWLVATGQIDFDKDQRRQHLNLALSGFEESLKLAKADLKKLVILEAKDMPIDFDSLPFPRRQHNRNVIAVRKRYEAQVVKLYQKKARVFSLQGDHGKAEKEILDGIEYLSLTLVAENLSPVEAEMRNLLGLTYERQGRDLDAFKQYRYVLRNVEPKNEISARGLQRLQDRARRGK